MSASAASVSNLNEWAFESVEERRGKPLACAYPCVFVDGIYLKRAWGDSFESVVVMVAMGMSDDGYREVVGAVEGFTKSAECWRKLISRLKGRGLSGVRMFIGDKAVAMAGTIAEVFSDAAYRGASRASTATCPPQGLKVQASTGGGDAQGDARAGIHGRKYAEGEGDCDCLIL